MNRVFVISDHHHFGRSVQRYLSFTRDIQTHVFRAPKTDGDTAEWVAQVFIQISDWIENKSENFESASSLRSAVAILDLSDKELYWLDDMELLQTSGGAWAAVASMLILAFPGVHWMIFAGGCATRNAEAYNCHVAVPTQFLECLNRVLKLNYDGYTSLFDPSGLRNMLRVRIKAFSVDGKKIAPDLPVRTKIAAAIDDEQAYAFLSAYAAYKFRFRAHVVSSYRMMKDLFSTVQPNGIASNGRVQFSLLFEDIYLRFRDGDTRFHLSDLRERDGNFSGLQHVRPRIFLTAGHSVAVDKERWEQNERYIEELKTSPLVETLYKPFSGIFDLWNKSGLMVHLGDGAPEENAAPSERRTSDSAAEQDPGGHSAPGRLLAVADRLIQRAESMLQSARSVPDAVQGALLALEAQELLCNRTPTTTLEAIALKHQLEATAECMFYGVEYNLNVIDRLDEIDREVAAVKVHFDEKRREISALSAKIRIISELSLVFRRFYQYDEEQECLRKIRELRRSMWAEKHPRLAFFFRPFRWYIETLLSSVWVFLGAILFWVVLFWGFYWLLCGYQSPHVSPIVHGFADSITTFFGLQLPHDLREAPGDRFVIIALFGMLLGFVHLGMLVSYLYSVVARK